MISDATQLFVWRCFLFLAKLPHPSQLDLFNQITESFMGVVIETNTWKVREVILMPIFLRSMGLYGIDSGIPPCVWSSAPPHGCHIDIGNQVFGNWSLNMKNSVAVGFDKDYNWAQYKLEIFESLAYLSIVQKLVCDLKFWLLAIVIGDSILVLTEPNATPNSSFLSEDWLTEDFIVFGFALPKMTNEELRTMISKTFS